MSRSLSERLSIPGERSDLDVLQIEGSRFAFFKELFGKSGKMAKINLLSILFALPAIAWFLYAFLIRKTYDTTIDYSGNLGLGYSMIENAVERGNFARFYAALQHYAILIPLIVIAFIGLGGAFYSMRRFAQGDDRITKNFFKGIRLTFADFFLHGLLAGISIFVLAINFTVYDAYGVHLVWKIFGIIGAIIFTVFALSYLLYACTISTAYKTGLKTIIKDSFLFVISFPLQTIFIALIGALPIVIMYFTLPGLFLNAGDILVTLLTTVGVSLVFFLGISLVVASWTVYTNYIYELAFESKKTVKNIEQKKLRKKH